MTHWRKTKVPNLIKNSLSGIYYARFTVLGKAKWVTLETTDFAVAVNRLNEERINLAKLREAMGATGRQGRYDGPNRVHLAAADEGPQQDWRDHAATGAEAF